MNKHGWGLRAELAFLLLFLVCILVSTIGLHRFGLLINQSPNDNGFGSSSTINYDFDSLERRVVVAAKNYYNDKYPAGNSDTIVVSVDTLKSNGYLSPLYDNKNKECKGYAMILKTGNCVSYIKCSYYKTVGYSEDYE